MGASYSGRCRIRGYNSDVCIFLSWMWDRVLGVNVGDVYEIFKQMFNLPGIEIVAKSVIEDIIKGDSSKVISAIEKVKNWILSFGSTNEGDVQKVVMLVPRAPPGGAGSKECKVRIRNVEKPFPAFYTAEKGVAEIECGRLVRKFRYGDVNPYPLPSWIKGYVREALHKLVFLELLTACINESPNQDKEKKCASILRSYVELISRDDENLIVEISIDGRKVQMLNIVGALLGTGVNASPLLVYQLDPEECVKECRREKDGVRCYAFEVDAARAYFASVLLEQMLRSDEEFTHAQSPAHELRYVLKNIDAVVANLVKASMYVKITEAQIQLPDFLIFVPFTAGIGSLAKYTERIEELSRVLQCYKGFVESVHVVIPKDRSVELSRALEALKTVLNLYAKYFIRKAMRATG